MKLFEHTDEETVELMRKVCAEHNLKLTFLGEDEGMGGYNYGGSTDEEIMLAPFVKAKAGEVVGKCKIYRTCENPIECRLATFFHELSHARLEERIPMKCTGFAWNRTSRFQLETWVTMLGLGYALEKFGLKFSDKTVKWILDEGFTYYHGDAGHYDLVGYTTEDGYSVEYDDWMEHEVDSRAEGAK